MTFFYRIAAVDSAGQLSRDFSDQTSATTSNFALDLASVDTLVTNGDTLTLSLTVIGNFAGAEVKSFQFTLSFDSTQIQGVSVDTTGFGFGSSAVVFTNVVPGALKFAAAFPDTLSGTNKVMNLIIEVKNDAQRDTTDLQFTEAFFNEGVPVLDLSSTSIRVKPRYGDISGNKSISSFDASLVLQHLVDLLDFSTGLEEKADVTFNGSVSALDAFLILKRATGSITSFPVEDSLFSKRSDPFDRNIDINVVKDISENGLLVTIETKKPQTVASLYLELEVPGSGLKYRGLELPGHLQNYLYADNFENGILRLALTGIAPDKSNGAIMTLRFDLPAGLTATFTGSMVTVRALEINDIDVTAAIEETGPDGVVKTFELRQNYPNPFNPVTTINYQIPEAANVILKIYNVLGQEVKTLVNEQVQAGTYSITWDGKNSSGVLVAGGVYIYRIRAGSHVITRKMVFVK